MSHLPLQARMRRYSLPLPGPANNCYRTLSAGPRIYGATRELVLLLPMHVRRDEMGWDQKRYTQLI